MGSSINETPEGTPLPRCKIKYSGRAELLSVVHSRGGATIAN